MLPFFADLVIRTDEARRAFETNPVVLDAVANGMPIERYRKLLLELYHVVWHFNPVCAAAASRIGGLAPADPLLPLRAHARGNGPRGMGHERPRGGRRARSDTLAHTPSPFTLALNGYNYWSADRRHPCSVLGMLYALEVIASVYGGPFASAIKESLLLEGDRGISFIGSHATMDAEHMAELRQVLNTVHDKTARDAVVESVLVNFHHFTRMFETI